MRQDVEDVALGAVREATARIQRDNVAACSAALEARIAPFVAAALAGDAVDAAARDLAREVFVSSITEAWFTLRRCSMGANPNPSPSPNPSTNLSPNPDPHPDPNPNPNTLSRCSMGEQMCEALGYAYVRQAQKVRGKHDHNPNPSPNPNPEPQPQPQP